MQKESANVADAIKSFVDDIVIRISIEATANLTEATPVDTGFARANWVPSIGAPSAETSLGAQEAGIAAMIGYTASQGPAFVTNNVPYIGALNAGSSTQAPSGFVEQAIERAVATTLQQSAKSGRLQDLAGKFVGSGTASAVK